MPQPGSTPIITYNSSTASQVPSAANLSQGELAINVTDKKLYTKDSGGNVILIASNGGDVTGPATATDNAIARFDTTTGRLIQNSVVTIADTTGNMAGVGTLTATTVNAALNGTLGATTPSTVAATTISASGVSTFSAGTAGAPAITTTGDTNTGMFFPAADTIAFSEGGTEAMRIDSSGNVGIGTASPYGLASYNSLTVGGAAGGGLTMYRFGSTNVGYVGGNNANELFMANLTAAGNITFATNSTARMTLNSSGNLGIGTASPADKLEVVSTDQYSGATIQGGTTAGASVLTLKNSNAAGIWQLGVYGSGISGTANDLYIYDGVANAVRAVMDNSGNLGIGSSTITGIGANVTTLKIAGRNTSNAGGIQLYSSDDTTVKARTWAETGGWYFDLQTAQPMIFNTSGTERMRLDSSGNLGLGVTPSAWSTNKAIQVGLGASFIGSSLYNSTDVGNNIYGNYSYLTTGSASFYRQFQGAHQWFNSPSGTAGNAITFTQAMTLDASGNLSTTGYVTSTGAEVIRVPADKEISFGNNTASLGIGQYFAAGTTRLTWYARTGGATLMELTTGGNLTISGATATKASGTTWANPSDIRLKDNVTDYSKGLAELMQVNVKEWTYNGKGGTTEGMKGLGVIADEIMTVLPNTVDNYQAKLNADDEVDTDIKKFDATEITWLMLNSIKEQQAMIDELKAKVAALEAA